MAHSIMDCYGSRLHCMWHDEDEPDQGAYLSCGECFHVFMTAQDLLAAHAAMCLEFALGTPRTDPEQIFSCPFCAHDFLWR